MNSIYLINDTIKSSQVDVNNKIKFDAILDFFQNLATAHATQMGMGFDKLKETSNAFWVLSKIRFSLEGDIKQNDEVILKTWPLEPTTVRFLREYTIFSDKGKVLGSSEWCILDFDTKMLRKFSTVKYPNDFCHLTNRSGAGEFLRLKEEVCEENYNHTHKSLFSDIDCNAHVNNVSYAKMALNAFTPDEFSSYNFKSFEIHFVSQTYYGSEIKIYKKKLDDGVYVEGRLDDKTVFRTLFIK